MIEGKDWKAIGKATLSQLPAKDKDAFIEWLNHNKEALEVYTKCPMDAVVMWQNGKKQKSPWDNPFQHMRMDYREEQAAAPTPPVWRGYETNLANLRAGTQGQIIPTENQRVQAPQIQAEATVTLAQQNEDIARLWQAQADRVYFTQGIVSGMWLDNPAQVATITGIGVDTTNTTTTTGVTDNNG